MRLALFLIFSFFLLSLTSLTAQVKTIKGKLPDKKATIEVQGRGIKTQTDKYGYYVLRNVTDDDVIVVNGQQTYKVAGLKVEVISEVNVSSVSSELESLKDTIGVNTVGHKRINYDGFYPYSYGHSSYYSKIRNVVEGKDKITIKGVENVPYGVSLSSYVDFAVVGRLPALQSEYSQGRNNVWRGADGNELLSWGKKITNLEYSGLNYPYDKNGSLVLYGFGNGVAAQTYDPYDFYRTGVSFGNKLGIILPGLMDGTTRIKLGQKKNNSPIPNAYFETYDASLFLNDIKWVEGVKTSAALIYQHSYGRLTGQGSNLSTLLHAVATTPPTFDNANGLSPNEAVNKQEAWLLADGTRRSYAKDEVLNPYELINVLPDHNKNDRLTAYARSFFNFNRWYGDANLSYNKLWDYRNSGIMTYPLDYHTERKESTSHLQASANCSYNPYIRYNISLIPYVEYVFNRFDDELHRNDRSLVGNTQLDRRLDRTTQEVKYGLDLHLYGAGLNLAVYNKHYFSNTLRTGDYLNLFPNIGLSWEMRRFLKDVLSIWSDYVNAFTVRGSITRSIGEPDLLYRNPASLSTRYKAENFRSFYEYQDIISVDKMIKPEIYLKSDVGLSYNPNGILSLSVNFFSNQTQNFISPVFTSPSFELENVGVLRNYGYNIQAGHFNRWGDTKLELTATFASTKSRVEKMNYASSFIPVAGFADVATVFAKGEPLGVIYGTTYLRDEQGQRVIGGDGYPLVDSQMKKIGDPTPDFMLSFVPELEYKGIGISFTMEYSHGGDRWNGTRAMLDYYGVSAGTGTDRTVKEYIFQGVDQAGNTNILWVDFFDPSLPMSQSRWIRYGMGGVGEEYIEDATYFRLANIALSYSFPRKVLEKIYCNKLKVGFEARNVFLLTAYQGVDPSSLLFGYASGIGLDLFNQPSTRNFSLFVNLEF